MMSELEQNLRMTAVALDELAALIRSKYITPAQPAKKKAAPAR
jgi:hypothetical protein